MEKKFRLMMYRRQFSIMQNQTISQSLQQDTVDIAGVVAGSLETQALPSCHRPMTSW